MLDTQMHEWKTRSWHRPGTEFWRIGPKDLELSVHQPHGTYWRMYVCSQPVVRSHDDRGVFETALDAMTALDALAALDLQTMLLD
jgi:hypothetical protein